MGCWRGRKDQEISIPPIPNLTVASRVSLGTKLPCFVATSEPQLQCFTRSLSTTIFALTSISFNLYSVDTMVTPTAARMMQATRARMFTSTAAQRAG